MSLTVPEAPMSRATRNSIPTLAPTLAPRLEVTDLSVHFGSRSALDRVTTQFSPAETVSLLGPNGAGKSTLLKVLAGMLPPSHGAVLFNGRPIRKPSPAVVYVPQRTGADWTFPVNVLDVVLMACSRTRSRFLPLGASERRRALEALEQVGMRRFADIQIGQLSGGQQQRVFLARALLEGGDVYLLDEPFSGVDIPTQELLVELFNGLREQGKTILYATHDLAQAAKSSDRVLLLNRRLVAAGPPRDVMTEANLRTVFEGQVVVVYSNNCQPPLDAEARP